MTGEGYVNQRRFALELTTPVDRESAKETGNRLALLLTKLPFIRSAKTIGVKSHNQPEVKIRISFEETISAILKRKNLNVYVLRKVGVRWNRALSSQSKFIILNAHLTKEEILAQFLYQFLKIAGIFNIYYHLIHDGEEEFTLYNNLRQQLENESSNLGTDVQTRNAARMKLDLLDALEKMFGNSALKIVVGKEITPDELLLRHLNKIKNDINKLDQRPYEVLGKKFFNPKEKIPGSKASKNGKRRKGHRNKRRCNNRQKPQKIRWSY